MGIWARLMGREARSLENPAVHLGADELMAVLGQIDPKRAALPTVTIESALEVPAVFAAVMFLSRTLAVLPLHSFRKSDGDAQRLDGALQMLINEAPNAEWSSYGWRQYMWQQVFTVGRGLTWIERDGGKVLGLWPMDAAATSVRRQSGRKIYRYREKEYPAADVIDVPFALKANQIDVYSPIVKGRKAIGLALAMNDFAGGFFAGGGVPPLALEGPLPAGPDAFRRAAADIQRAIDLSKRHGQAFFGMPPGHSLKPIGVDPDKGQMTEARVFQIQEIARQWGLPPVFVQDLSTGTMNNVEQQDLNVAKHVITHHAKAFEDEANLKLFGQRRRATYVEHILDGLQRGDFKSRIEALARGIQTAQLTPDEARALENRPPDPSGHGARLHIQGATVPLGSQPIKPEQPSPEETIADADQPKPAD